MVEHGFVLCVTSMTVIQVAGELNYVNRLGGYESSSSTFVLPTVNVAVQRPLHLQEKCSERGCAAPPIAGWPFLHRNNFASSFSFPVRSHMG
jgi:hypothetical protein